MTVWWAKPTLDDIAAQRAMIERGEEKRKADWKQAERERLRDTFAAAALTGLMQFRIDAATPGAYVKSTAAMAANAYDIANAMLRERDKQSVGVAEMDSVADRKSVATPRACASSCSQPFDSAPTTHDAAPEAKAASSPLWNPVTAGLGTGNTPSKAEIDALEFVVEEGRIGNYGILRSWLIRLRPEWESQSYEESNEKRVNTNTERVIDRAAYEGDIVSRLKHWRGLHLAHSGELFEEAASAIESLREAIRRLADQDATLSAQDGSVTVTLDATLTDEEREAIETAVRWLEPYPQVASTLRKLFERLGGER
jgi:hypothetical protein